MRKYLVLLWLLLPLPVVVLHFGRGQQWLALDKAGDLVRKAETAEKQENWAQADQFYQQASKQAGAQDNALRMRLDLAQTRTRYRMGEAVEAIDRADRLLDDAALKKMPVDFQREARELAGRIHYYAGWVMRLEGAGRELWMEEAELARQSFRLLTEKSESEGAVKYASTQQENLESAVQLQRLSLTELMARPLPKEGQCMCNQGLTEQMNKRRGQRGKKPGRCEGGEGPPDKGAGMKRFEPGEGS